MSRSVWPSARPSRDHVWINASWVLRKVTLWSGPPSVYTVRLTLLRKVHFSLYIILVSLQSPFFCYWSNYLYQHSLWKSFRCTQYSLKAHCRLILAILGFYYENIPHFLQILSLYLVFQLRHPFLFFHRPKELGNY